MVRVLLRRKCWIADFLAIGIALRRPCGFMPFGVHPLKIVLYARLRHVNRPIIGHTLEQETHIQVFILKSAMESIKEIREGSASQRHLVLVVYFPVGIHVVIFEVSWLRRTDFIHQAAVVDLLLAIEIAIAIMVVDHIAPLLADGISLLADAVGEIFCPLTLVPKDDLVFVMGKPAADIDRQVARDIPRIVESNLIA